MDSEEHRWNFPNPAPLLSSALVPEFGLLYSDIQRLSETIPADFSVSEHYIGGDGSEMVDLFLYAFQYDDQAQAAAEKAILKVLHSEEGLLKATPPASGTFSGRPLGSMSWCRRRAGGEAGLLIVSGAYYFWIIAGHRDESTARARAENLAGKLLYQLRSWQRPGMAAMLEPRPTEGQWIPDGKGGWKPEGFGPFFKRFQP